MLKKLAGNIKRAKEWHTIYNKQLTLSKKVRIKNKELAFELELERKKRNGILTYSEYLYIDQFGENGFYATSKYHGKTDVEKRWGDALTNYCLSNGHDIIIEVGCGSGELGVATAKAYKQQTNKQLSWMGVEIDKNLHPKILENFTAQNLQGCIEKIAVNLEELPLKQNPLIVFPYCLDNIPPQIFVNTKPYTSYPNAILGINVQNGMLTETIIPPDILHKKRIKLENGLLTSNDVTCKLSTWKLRNGQRAFFSSDAFITLYQYVNKFENPAIIIIDEFRKEPLNLSLENLGTPRSLYEKNLIIYDRDRYYRESGKHNLYYPLYRDTFLKFLTSLGFQSVAYEVEQKKAAELRGKPWFPVAKNHTTYSFIAKDKIDKETSLLPILFSPQRIW